MKILRELLKKRGFTQQEFGELVGVPQPTVASWISGKGTPKHDSLVKMAQILGVSPEELLGRERPANFDDMAGWVKLRIIGNVPAGVPIEAIEEYSGEIVVPPEHARPGCFALEVHGNSMSPKIMDGDVVVVAPCPDPHNGQIVVTRINSDNEVTLKRFQRTCGTILLIPENVDYPSYVLTPDGNIKILGSVIALHRKF